MKKLINKVTVFFLFSIIFILFLTFLLPFKYTDSYNVYLSQNREINTTNVIIGDSRSLSGIIPKNLSNNYTNLSFQGSTPFEGYLKLEDLITSGKKLDTVFLCYGATHFEASDYFWRIAENERLITVNRLIDLIKLEFKFNVLYTDKRKKPTIWNSFLALLKYYNLPKSRNVGYSRISADFKDKLSIQRGYLLLGDSSETNRPNQESKEEYFRINPIIQYYFHKIDKLAIENEIKVFFIPPPISRISYQKTKRIYYKEFGRVLSMLDKETSIDFLEYLQVYPNNFFGDPSHLNQRGAIVFSNFIKKKIIINCDK